jgi:hypothetical protein
MTLRKTAAPVRVRTKAFLLALSLPFTAVVVRAQSLNTALSIPSEAAVAGASLELKLIAFNAGTTARSLTIPAVLPASLVIGGRSWPLELHADSPSHSTVAPGSFIAQPYCGGANSRSVNTADLRSVFFVGPADGWRLVLVPEVLTYLGGAGDIAEYRGYGQLRGSLGKANGPLLAFTSTAGKGLDHRSVQLDMTYPVHVRFLDMSIFVLVQYFNGYGESLLSYNQKSESLRLGVALVR